MRCGGEVQFFRDCHEVAQMSQLHAGSLLAKSAICLTYRAIETKYWTSEQRSFKLLIATEHG
jgi:hypothetical protein